MRRSRQVILMILVLGIMAISISALAIYWSSGKGDDEAQSRVFVENATEDMARFRGSTTTKPTTTTVTPTTTKNFLKAVNDAYKLVFVMEAAKARQQEAAKPQPARMQSYSNTYAPEIGTGSCGGDLPPCWIMMRESGGNIRAKNPSSSASGKWQMLDSTWNGYGGYAHAADAPEWVQDAKARTMALCNWQPPNYCG